MQAVWSGWSIEGIFGRVAGMQMCNAPALAILKKYECDVEKKFSLDLICSQMDSFSSVIYSSAKYGVANACNGL